MSGKKTESRAERDQFGELQIPGNAYWGACTQRSLDSSMQEGGHAHPRLVDAAVSLKKAAAAVNAELGRLSEVVARAIAQAADEVLLGQWRNQFVVDAYVAGGASAFLANVNEVLANRAGEILGDTAGSYLQVHPVHHVGLGQGTTDTYSAAARLAILMQHKDLEPILLDLERLLRRKSVEFDRIVKVGRIGLRDSLPVTLGQEFNAFGSIVQHAYKRLSDATRALLELPIGCTAGGTGVDSTPQFTARVAERLELFVPLRWRSAEDTFRVNQSVGDFLEYSSALRILAADLSKIAADLRLLASGPAAGLGEIALPFALSEPLVSVPSGLPVQVPPVLPDLLQLVSFQILSNDAAVVLSAQAGQLETNTMLPLIAASMLNSMDLLKRTLPAFNKKCIAGVTANQDRCQELLEVSTGAALRVVSMVSASELSGALDESSSSKRSLRTVLSERGLLSEEQYDTAPALKTFTQSGTVSGAKPDEETP